MFHLKILNYFFWLKYNIFKIGFEPKKNKIINLAVQDSTKSKFYLQYSPVKKEVLNESSGREKWVGSLTISYVILLKTFIS